MGFYAERVFPWLNDRLGKDRELRELRTEALAPARGRVIEPGFGTGLNLPHYPQAVRSVAAVEPSGGMQRRAAKRVSAAAIPVDIVTGCAERLPFDDRSFDTAVLTLTLCSVDDPAASLRELKRVLRPDGILIVLEHGRSEDANVARWQDRLNRIQNVLACGCNINRPIRSLVEEAGFHFQSVRTFYWRRGPRTHTWITAGTARLSGHA